MTFEIHSDITNHSMTIAARAMRKVLRRKRSILLGHFRLERLFIQRIAADSIRWRVFYA